MWKGLGLFRGFFRGMGAKSYVSTATPVWTSTFESNDFSEWGAGEVDTGNQIDIVGSGAHGGTYAMRHQLLAATNAFIRHNYGSNITEGYLDFYFKFNDVTALAAASYTHIYARIYNTAVAAQQFRLELVCGASPFNLSIIQVIVGGPNTTLQSSGLSWSIDTWYKIRWYWKQATGANNDGIVRVWRDADLVIESTNLANNATGVVGYWDFGCVGGTGWLTDNGTIIYYDDFALYTGTP